MTHSQKATIFAAGMMMILCCSFIMAITHTDPLVLGTEMNTNGHMEYLCLGRSCEDIF